MIIIHAVQKLLNTGKVKPVLYISEPSAGQHMHSWYAKLLSTGFAGKFLVMYVHQPSLLTVLTRSKTINSTISQFYNRLPALLARHNFKPAFIESEMKFIHEGYVISKTNSKSMLGHLNELTLNIEILCRRFPSYEAIDLEDIENAYTGWISFDKTLKKYKTVMEYWMEKEALVV